MGDDWRVALFVLTLFYLSSIVLVDSLIELLGFHSFPSMLAFIVLILDFS